MPNVTIVDRQASVNPKVETELKGGAQKVPWRRFGLGPEASASESAGG